MERGISIIHPNPAKDRRPGARGAPHSGGSSSEGLTWARTPQAPPPGRCPPASGGPAPRPQADSLTQSPAPCCPASRVPRVQGAQARSAAQATCMPTGVCAFPLPAEATSHRLRPPPSPQHPIWDLALSGGRASLGRGRRQSCPSAGPCGTYSPSLSLGQVVPAPSKSQPSPSRTSRPPASFLPGSRSAPHSGERRLSASLRGASQAPAPPGLPLLMPLRRQGLEAFSPTPAVSSPRFQSGGCPQRPPCWQIQQSLLRPHL